MIFSTVRSLPKSRVEKNPTHGWLSRNLGFITDENQINVALTRARKGLIIIGTCISLISGMCISLISGMCISLICWYVYKPNLLVCV